MICIYCNGMIYKDYPGWGWSEILHVTDVPVMDDVYWHSECFQRNEDILLESPPLTLNDWDLKKI